MAIDRFDELAFPENHKLRLTPEEEAWVLDPANTLEQIAERFGFSRATAMRVRQRIAEGDGWYCDEFYPSRQPRSSYGGRAAGRGRPEGEPIDPGPEEAVEEASAPPLIAWYGPSVQVLSAQDEALRRLYPGMRRAYQGIAGNALAVRRLLTDILARDCVVVASETTLEHLSAEGVQPLRPVMRKIARVQRPETDMEWRGQAFRFEEFERILRLGTEYGPLEPARTSGVPRVRWISRHHALGDRMRAELRRLYGPSLQVVVDRDKIRDVEDLRRRVRGMTDTVLVGPLSMYADLTARGTPVLRPVLDRDTGQVDLRRVTGVWSEVQRPAEANL